LGTHPTTDCHSTLRHPESVRSVTERITDQPLPASHNRTPSQSAAPPRSVHAVEPRWGRIGGALPISARHGSLPPMRIVVLGGGVVGVTTAYQLQRDGHEVVVVERNPEVAAGASWGNAGMIAPGHSFVWSSPRAPVILAKSLMLKDQALRFRLSADPRLYAWTWGFLKQCTSAKARRNTLLKHRLAAYSQTVLDRVVAEEAI